MINVKEKKSRSKLKKAVALKYQAESDNAPKLVAKGKGGVAEKIIAVAKEHGIPIHEDSDLLEILSTLEIEQEIPAALYSAIAEILAFIYRVNDPQSGQPDAAKLINL